MAESTDIECRAHACAAARLLGLRVGMEDHSICAGLNSLQQPTVYCSSLLYVQFSVASTVGVVLGVSRPSDQWICRCATA